MRAVGDGLEIGAMTTLTEVVRHPVVREKYGILPNAAEAAASPQIRNQGTIGGNVSQDARCWYYRGGWPCYRAGGNICYADTPTGLNREHAILDADRCVAVNPSDTAPALIALDAKFVIRTPKGERVVNAEDYFIGPGIDITRMTILQPGDLLTSIRIPSTWAGSQFYFEKVRDRKVWDFALVNVAAAMVTVRRHDPANSPGGERRGRSSGSPHSGRGRRDRKAAQRGNGAEMAGQLADPGRRALAIQRLQGAADEKSGEARDSRRGRVGGNLNLIEWATSPWGQQVPIHIAWSLLWVSAIGALLFLIVHAIYVTFGRSPPAFRSGVFRRRGCGANSRARRRGTRWRAAVSRDHGAVHVRVAVHGVSAQSGRAVCVGHYHWIAGIVLSISVIYHIFHASFVAGLLVHLA